MSKAFFTDSRILNELVEFTPLESPESVGIGGVKKNIARSIRKNISNWLSFLTGFIALMTSVATAASPAKQPIVITSQTLTADNINNTVTFEGSAVAKSEDMVISSDKMVVSYEDSHSKIVKIHASGNVRVHKGKRAIFSKEATYMGEEEKVVFTGDPKAVEGENIITGSEIIYYLKNDRAVVKSSRVILKKGQ